MGIRRLFLCMVIVVMVPATASQAQDLPPLCQRGAEAAPVRPEHALMLEVNDYYTTHASRVPFPEFVSEDAAAIEAAIADFTFRQSIEWPGVLADRAAELPAAAHDLPWLVMLAWLDARGGTGPVWALTLGPESSLLPHMLPILRRHGLSEEARVLTMAVALFPTWDADPQQRSRMLTEDGSATYDPSLAARLDSLEGAWPSGRARAEAAAMALLRQAPEVGASLQARIDGLDGLARLDLLMEQLWSLCVTDVSDASRLGRDLSRIGAAQAALLLMDSLDVQAEGPSLYDWFADDMAAHSEMLERLLDRRGLSGAAQALRDGIALFPAPFPRDIDSRWSALQSMDPASISRLDNLLDEADLALIRPDMVTLARAAGLLPR